MEMPQTQNGNISLAMEISGLKTRNHYFLFPPAPFFICFHWPGG